MRPVSDLFCGQAIYDESRIEVLELANILPWLTIKHDGLNADSTLVFEALMHMPTTAAERLSASSRPSILGMYLLLRSLKGIPTTALIHGVERRSKILEAHNGGSSQAKTL